MVKVLCFNSDRTCCEDETLVFAVIAHIPVQTLCFPGKALRVYSQHYTTLLRLLTMTRTRNTSSGWTPRPLYTGAQTGLKWIVEERQETDYRNPVATP